MTVPIIEVEDLQVRFQVRSGALRRRSASVSAVDGVSFQVHEGETLGLVGESGCGKTTTGRVVLRLQQPTSGRVRYRGDDVGTLDRAGTRRLCREVQAVFQDPYDSLDPSMTVERIVAEPLAIHRLSKGNRRDRVHELLATVGLDETMAARHPGALSGGQRQRVGIARALSVEPAFLVCDEPVSALDVSIQSQVINLLQRLQRELGLAYLFIAHDLSIVRYLSNRIAVMYAGRLVELADSETLVRNPRHPYTRALLASVPIPDPTAGQIDTDLAVEGEAPSPLNPPTGCRFHPRCPFAQSRCRTERPQLEEADSGHVVACHFHSELPPVVPIGREGNSGRPHQ